MISDDKKIAGEFIFDNVALFVAGNLISFILPYSFWRVGLAAVGLGMIVRLFKSLE